MVFVFFLVLLQEITQILLKCEKKNTEILLTFLELCSFALVIDSLLVSFYDTLVE